MVLIISMMEAVNWKMTKPFLRMEFLLPLLSSPLSTCIGIKEERYIEGYNPAASPIMTADNNRPGASHHADQGMTRDLAETILK